MAEARPGFIRQRACPACGSGRIRPHRQGTYSGRLTRDDIKITDSRYGQTWDMSLCLECGHLFADPRPTPEFIFSLYGEVEDPLYEDEAEGRSRNFLGILKRLESLVPGKGPIFDVGAATGILLDLARSRGWQPDGIEPSAWGVGVAAAKYGLSLRQGPFESASLPGDFYAAVTMVDIIEHTPIPFEAAKKANRILRPGGVLALVTPDIHSGSARIAGRRWWHLRPAHLAFFSRASLAALLGRAGFTIVRERRYAWTFSLHYLLSRTRASGLFLRNRQVASLSKKIRLKLALGDSFEVYAVKEERA
jgi:2-polyprenyl-3-methyl-5-hydroxy-6-metoxy-1,4-benzoquinol methylase